MGLDFRHEYVLQHFYKGVWLVLKMKLAEKIGERERGVSPRKGGWGVGEGFGGEVGRMLATIYRYIIPRWPCGK